MIRRDGHEDRAKLGRIAQHHLHRAVGRVAGNGDVGDGRTEHRPLIVGVDGVPPTRTAEKQDGQNRYGDRGDDVRAPFSCGVDLLTGRYETLTRRRAHDRDEPGDQQPGEREENRGESRRDSEASGGERIHRHDCRAVSTAAVDTHIDAVRTARHEPHLPTVQAGLAGDACDLVRRRRSGDPRSPEHRLNAHAVDVVARRTYDHFGETGHDGRWSYDGANHVRTRRAIERDVGAADMCRRDDPGRDGECDSRPTFHLRTLVIQRPRARPMALVAVAMPTAINICTGNGHEPADGGSNRRVIASYDGAMK